MGEFPNFAGKPQIVGGDRASGSAEGGGIGKRVVASRLPAFLGDFQSNRTLVLDDAIGESIHRDPVGGPRGGSKVHLALDLIENNVDVVVFGDLPQRGNRIANVDRQQGVKAAVRGVDDRRP